MALNFERFSYPVLCGLLAERPTPLSQAMHNAAMRELGLNFVFVAFPTQSAETALRAMREMGMRGFSVTIPYKETVVGLLDQLSEEAREIGAVNTIVNNGEQLSGHNTDCAGIVEAFREAGVDVSGKQAAVLGAGGAAKAAVYALHGLGAGEISVINRNAGRAAAVAESFGVKTKDYKEFVKAPFAAAEILINATPLGSPGQTAEDYPFSFSGLKSGLSSRGLCYFECVTMETPLEAAALKAGATVISGSRMLLHQAVEQFRLFTGEEPPVRVMERALLDCLK